MDLDSYVIVRALSKANLGGPKAGARRTRSAEGTRRAPKSEITVETASAPSAKDLRDVRADPRTLSVAPVMRLKLHRGKRHDRTAPPTADVAWGVRAVGAVESPFDGSGVCVAVLDTGIVKHTAFKHITPKRQDFTGEGLDDTDGHGTHCAGTIFGGVVDGMRIGIAPNVEKALIGKVIGKEGATTAVLVKAVQWALEEGAHVISMSLGFDFPSSVDDLVKRRGLPLDIATSRVLTDYRENLLLFDRLFDLVESQSTDYQACLIVAASGNESRRDEKRTHEVAASPPSNARGVLSVGALGQSESGLLPADFSNTRVALAAPGVEIPSAQHTGGLVAWDGTSMATPHVAGVAALWAQKLMKGNRTLDHQLLKGSVLASCVRTSLDARHEAEQVGAGIVQAPR